jgi:hypothetical protein
MTQEQLRMQMLAGIITEGQYKQLLEDEAILNRILDKISSKGIDSISPYEKEYLDAYAQEKELPPVEFLDNGTLRDAFFVSGDKDLEVDKDIFIDYILTQKNKLKKLWNSSGGDWDQDQITDDDLKQAADLFYQQYPKRYDGFFDDFAKPELQFIYWDSPRENFAQNILILFDENIENMWLNIFLDDLNDIINS